MRFNSRTLAWVLLSIILLSTMAIGFTSVPTAQAQPSLLYDNFGPLLDQILIKVYGGRDAEFEALRTGQIDMTDWPLDYNTYTQLLADPTNFAVSPLTMIDMYNLEMNNVKWPTSDVWIRKAIAYLFDRQTFYQNQLKSFSGSLLDSPIATEWTQWHSAIVKKYPFSRTTAAQVLTNHGYWDSDGDSVREYHNVTGTFELPPLTFWIRSDDPDRQAWGQQYMLPELLAIGLPVEPHVAPKTSCWEAVMKYPYNYHLYTGGWGPYRDPDFLYDQYHTKFGQPYLDAHRDWANNYVFFSNSTFDSWATQLKNAPTMEAAVEPCMKAQEILMDQVPMIPGWHSAGAIGYRKNYGHWAGEEAYWDKAWTRVVNTKVISGMGTGGANGLWTFLNAHPADTANPTDPRRGGTIRYGFMTDADVFNPVHADFYWDWEFLNKIYEFLVTCDPETGADIPWMAKSWALSTWNNAGTPATKVTFELFKNILWHDNVKFTAYDVEFTMNYMKEAYSALFYPYTLDIDHMTVIDDYTIEIYYKFQSCWALHWAGGVPMIPKHIWQNIPAAQSRQQGEYETTGKLTGSGPFKFFNRVQGQSITLVANPTYFRKLVRPDYYSAGQPIPTHDGDVDIDDFGMAVGHFFCAEPWTHAVDPSADVNKDRVVDIDDIMEIGVRYLKTDYYPYVGGYPNYYFPPP